MYRSYSPSESNQVAVVPHSSPLAYQGSPASAFSDDFGCSPPPQLKRPRLSCAPSSSGFSFAEFADLIAANAATATLCNASALSPPTPFGSDTASFPPSVASGGYGFDALQQQQQCEDSKVDLANFLQTTAEAAAAVAAMQQHHHHQQAQQRQGGRLSSGLDIPSPAQLSEKDYSIIVHQQPEEYYRARYETEGIRGPMKGRENNHPAVRILGPMTYSGTVRVSLVHEDGTKHSSCFLDETKDRQKALSKKIDPQSNMIVEFEDLRIRRETKSKNYSKDGGRKADKAKSARNDKTACLCFVATLQLAQDREVKLQILSKPIQLCAPPEGAELEWLIPEYGHANGDEKIVIKGTKMTCPKVTFTVLLPDTQVVELLGHVDKEQSHQNVLVVKTPRLPDELRNYQGHTLKAEVRVSSGRAGTCSAPLPFYYIPNGVCHTCRQTLPTPVPVPVQQPLFPYHCGPPGIFFAAGSSSPQHQCGNVSALPPFQEIVPQVAYPPRACQEQMVNTSVTLSHPPSLSNASTPSPIPAQGSRRDSFQQLFDSPGPIPPTTTASSGHGATAQFSQSPNLSPTSSPGPVSCGGTDSGGPYWNPTHLGPHSVSITAPQHQEPILSIPDFSTSSLVTSPGSEPVYSAVPSPDTTTPIYQPMQIHAAYLEDPNVQYRQS